jgi:uncharacterized membrane protein
MWILKGISLGLGLFFVGSIVYIVDALSPIETNKATGMSVLLALTVWNPWYWVAFVSTLTLSCWLVRRTTYAKSSGTQALR